MNIKTITKFIYWQVMPITLGATMFYYLNKIEDIREFLIMGLKAFILAILFIIIHVWIGHKIFPEKITLADKIMRCRLRMKYGHNYCAKCPDSYECATDFK